MTLKDRSYTRERRIETKERQIVTLKDRSYTRKLRIETKERQSMTPSNPRPSRGHGPNCAETR